MSSPLSRNSAKLKMPGARQDAAKQEMEMRAQAAVKAAQDAALYLERYDKAELQEMVSRRSNDWLLSLWEGSKHAADVADGLAPGLPKPEAYSDGDDCRCVFLLDFDVGHTLLLRELQQIVRELVTGIYVFNQLPALQFDPLPDGSALVNLPHAYQDTRLGQLLLSTAYGLPCFLCGTYLTTDKRNKLVEYWHEAARTLPPGVLPDDSKLDELFSECGLQLLSEDDELATFYKQTFLDTKSALVGHGGDAKSSVDASREACMMKEKEALVKFDERASIQLVLEPLPCKCYRGLVMPQAECDVTSYVRLPATGIKREEWHHLQAGLQRQREFCRKLLIAKKSFGHELRLLQFATSVAVWLTSLRKLFKVPDISTFLPPYPAEQLATSRELPPIFVSCPAACHAAPRNSRVSFIQSGGAVMAKRTLRVEEVSSSIAAAYDYLYETACECRTEELFASSVTPLSGRQYYVMGIVLESYYPNSPKVPRWIHSLYSEIHSVAARIGPITEAKALEQFRKHFGTKQASKMKSVNAGLIAAAERGLTAVFEALSKRCAESRLSKVDDVSGLALMHHAALYDRARIIVALARLKCDIHMVTDIRGIGPGMSTVQLAAQSGHLDTVAALLCHGAKSTSFTPEGLGLIHLACLANASQVIKLLVQLDGQLLEQTTRDSFSTTPLILASEVGALDVVQTLIELGADSTAQDAMRRDPVRIATQYSQIEVLKFFTTDKRCVEAMASWDIFTDMLSSAIESNQPSWALSAIVALLANDLDNWHNMLKAKHMPHLVKLMDNSQTQEQAVMAVRLISVHANAQEEIIATSGIIVLVKLLSNPSEVVQSHAAVVLTDLLVGSLSRQDLLAEEKAIPALVCQLDSNEEHLLLNSLCALTYLVIEKHSPNQAAVTEADGLPRLVRLLEHSHGSDDISKATTKLILKLCEDNTENQLSFFNVGGIPPLVNLIGASAVCVQVAAADALKVVVTDNIVTQKAVTSTPAIKLLKGLLKMADNDVKVSAATALWATAGSALVSQRLVAYQVTIDVLINLVELQTEALEIVGTEALCALGRGARSNQVAIASAGGVLPLVRLLRPIAKCSEAVLLRTVQALATLCIAPAHCANTDIQKAIADAQGVELMAHLIIKESSSPLLKAMTAWTLSCAVLAFPLGQTLLLDTPFRINYLFDMWNSHLSNGDESDAIFLALSRALTNFAYGNLAVQKVFVKLGGLPYQNFLPFLHSTDEELQAHSAFQVIVLSSALTGCKSVETTVLAIQQLISLLPSHNDEVKMLAADCLASLAHMRAGLPPTIVAAGGIDCLIQNLFTPNKPVRDSAAIALGYLSFDATASRVLLSASRAKPEVADKLIHRTYHISPNFVEDWKMAKKSGLPSLSLEVNGGPKISRCTRAASQSTVSWSTASSRQAYAMPTASNRSSIAMTTVQQPSRFPPLDASRGRMSQQPPSPFALAAQRTAKRFASLTCDRTPDHEALSSPALSSKLT